LLNYKIFLQSILVLIISSCSNDGSVEITDEPCISVPCGSDNSNWIEPAHRVSSLPEYRIGKWLNIKKGSNHDTIIFHSEKYWSRTNSFQDLDSVPYSFDYSYFMSKGLTWFLPVSELHREVTIFNDTTGIFSIRYQDGLNTNQIWDHYIKIQ
jgi:hypothetical protein